MRRHLGVLGHPVAHSLSPVLHAAAYEHLALDWAYNRYEVRETELA
ncbi:MAG: shikimate dehydrogenase, partial [Microcella sp.]|nr:shikimate dehydrogenase [Microcella sp.]